MIFQSNVKPCLGYHERAVLSIEVYMMCWCYASIKHPMFSQEENWCLGRHKNIFLAVKVQYLLTLFFVKCLMLNKSLWNNIIKNFAWMNTGAFNIIFRKSSLKVILEIGIFSEFILLNYFVKYLDTSIVHFSSKI